MTRITKHLVNLRERIRRACELAGRNENEVSILAVSKRHDPDAVAAAHAAGLRAFGENYVQEAVAKMPHCPTDIEWHFIGPVQSNKTRAIAERFAWVHTLAGAKAARRLSRQRRADLPDLQICIQVCTDPDGTHAGVRPDEAAGLCELVAELPRLRLRGLMTLPLPAEGTDAQRRPFRRLRELRDDLVTRGYALDTLSMGMSDDLEAAVLEGSTLVRIGTALFGPRPE